MISYFNNNEGLGGFEKGAYDSEASHPSDTNWTRQSRFVVPDTPRLIWKADIDDHYIDETDVSGAFVVDRNQNIIISDCDNNIVGQHYGRIIQIDSSGKTEEIFRTDMRLKPPVLGKDGLIYFTTTGPMDSYGHKLFCLFPDGKKRWEFTIDRNAFSKPVIDKMGNIYIYVYGDKVGKLLSVKDDGVLNWEYSFNSVNWYEPVISQEGIIYIGLNVNQKLCAFDKDGQKLWERVIGQGLGSYPPVIIEDGTSYACLSNTLFAINSDGSIKWKYRPKEGVVATAAAIDKAGNLYVNLSNFRLISLNSEGDERWETKVKGATTTPPIIGKDNKLYQQSFMEQYPQYKSWIETFTKTGERIWIYELDGSLVSTVLANDNLIYALSNNHTYRKKGWTDKMIVRWELRALGN